MKSTDFTETQRQEGVRIALDELHEILDYYLGAKPKCTKNCDIMAAGSLAKSMKSIGLLPKPVAPYDGISRKIMDRKINALHIVTYCKLTGEGKRCKCNLKATLKKLRSDLAPSRDEMTLQRFARKIKMPVSRLLAAGASNGEQCGKATHEATE